MQKVPEFLATSEMRKTAGCLHISLLTGVEHGGERGQEGQDGDGGGGQANVPVPSFPTCQTDLSSYLNT